MDEDSGLKISIKVILEGKTLFEKDVSRENGGLNLFVPQFHGPNPQIPRPREMPWF